MPPLCLTARYRPAQHFPVQHHQEALLPAVHLMQILPCVLLQSFIGHAVSHRASDGIVARFHSATEAKRQKEAFIKQFKEGVIPEDIPDVRLTAGPDGLLIANLLKEAQLTQSTSDAMRMIKQGAVKIDGSRVEDAKLTIAKGTTAVFQVGKRRFAKVSVQ